MSLYSPVRIIQTLILILAFHMVGSVHPICAAEPQDLEQKFQKFNAMQTHTDEDDSIFKGIGNENLLQEAIPLDINIFSICEFMKLKTINGLGFIHQNYYYLMGGVLGGSVVYRLVNDPGFYICFLPNILLDSLIICGVYALYYFADEYVDEQKQRQQCEMINALKLFQRKFIGGAIDFMNSTDGSEKHNATS